MLLICCCSLAPNLPLHPYSALQLLLVVQLLQGRFRFGVFCLPGLPIWQDRGWFHPRLYLAPPGAKTGPRNFDWRRPVRSFPVRLFPHLPGNPKQFGPKVARKAPRHVVLTGEIESNHSNLILLSCLSISAYDRRACWNIHRSSHHSPDKRSSSKVKMRH